MKLEKQSVITHAQRLHMTLKDKRPSECNFIITLALAVHTILSV